LRKPVAAQKAKARMRRRARTAEAPTPDLAPPVAAVIAFPRDDEPPFDPPDAEDMLGLGDCEEELEFAVPAPAPIEEEPLELVVEQEAPANEADDVFDPPDEADNIFNRFERIEAAFPAANDTAPAPKPLSAAPRVERPAAPPLPAISLHLCWDRTETASMFATLAADRRFAAAEIEGMKGGVDAAIQRYAQEPSPDLLVLDSALQRDALIAGVRELFTVLAPATKVVVLSGVNDITLMRELVACGVSEYAVAPFAAAEIGETLCRLFEDADKSHVIAVIGARGGVGASTIAQNIAWSIAERQQAGTALVDLDLAFGAAAANFKHEPQHSIAEALLTPEDLEAALDRGTTHHTARLKLLSAPATVARDFEIGADSVQTVVTRVRRTSAYVVLDLPHAWNDWIKQTLLTADSVLIVSGPDLASLRNADNMLKLLRSESARVASPVIVLSMVGVPKRPEIPAKDFTEALMLAPAESFAFDPALFAEAAIAGLTIGEHAPASKAARAIDELATLLTGREAAPAKPARASERQRPASPPPQTQAPLELVHEAPPDRFAEARKVGEAELERLAAGQPKPRKRTGGLMRAAMAMLAFGVAGAWIGDRQRETAVAAETRVAPENPASAAVTTAPTRTARTEAPPLDNAARYAAAVQMLETGQIGEGIGALRMLAEEGHAQAQYSMAKIYERGEGVQADAAVARQWTERAAVGGHSRAMHDLGVYYARTGANAENDAAAFRWFRQAAERGVADSQYNLGIFYQQGRSVSEDPAEALFWFTLAARDGDEAAALRVTALQEQLTAVQVENARARAQAFRPQAAPAN
jgi:pilus assembly protein CpaE